MPYRKGANLPSYLIMVIVKWIILITYMVTWLCIVFVFGAIHCIIKAIVVTEGAVLQFLLTLEGWAESKLDRL